MPNTLAKVEFQPAVIEADFASMEIKVRQMVEPFADVTPEQAAAMDTKEAKACRSQLKAWSNEINEARKAIKREYSRPLQIFEQRVKELDNIINEPLNIIDAAIKAKEDMERSEREDQLRAHYEEFAPMLQDVLPFDRILKPEWLNKTGFQKRFAELEAVVQRITTMWDTLNDMDLYSPSCAKTRFWQSLDLADAIEYDASLKRHDERVKEMQRQREEMQSSNRPAEEPAAPAIEPQFAECFNYVLHIREVTQTQVEDLKNYLRANNIHGTIRREAQ